ncbi:toprim domain-containing protein [Halomonas sp. CKK8]|uniref:toprim domain-containing protein n=1 Tax=Halomonas sp. CKK8 TaxID=3036127 RepID=UPI0024157243|nr:toprim domain-containing protein [Halomonas sp. CKK8]WFM71824.1 toprim domain-containing protein [Halomonas sp. CKK8]
MATNKKPPTGGSPWAVYQALAGQLDVQSKLADDIFAHTGAHVQIIANGVIHRHDHPDGKRGNKRLWYVCRHDFACWGDWRTGEHRNVFADANPDPETARKARQEAERRRQDRRLAEARKHAQAATQAQEALLRLPEADPLHSYLVKKQIAPFTLRQDGQDLVAFLTDGHGVVGYQTISPDEEKCFLAGTAKVGAYWPLGHVKDGIAVCEGVATAIAIHMGYGCAVAAAMDCGNLKPVALSLRARHPDIPIIIMADNDHHRDNNPGVTHGKAAAEAVDGKCIYPTPIPGREDKGSDFNDLFLENGGWLP